MARIASLSLGRQSSSRICLGLELARCIPGVKRLRWSSGGTGALGSAVAARLAGDSHAVAFTYRKNAERASELKLGIQSQGAIAFAGTPDISDADAVRLFVADVVAHFGRLDALVYAAGPSFSLDFVSNVSPDEWRRVLDADLNGCFNVIHACLPHLRSSSGSIVAVTAAGIECARSRETFFPLATKGCDDCACSGRGI